MNSQIDTLSLGFSPCPNDTFIFYGLVHGLIDPPGVTFAEPVLEDVEKLNLWAMAEKLDVTKLSFHALGHALEEYCLLSSGSALGRGCGRRFRDTGRRAAADDHRHPRKTDDRRHVAAAVSPGKPPVGGDAL
jgi:1,4-dihydroxy-6-naphthoate synthase